MSGNAVIHGIGVTATCCIQALAANAFTVTAPEARATTARGTVLLSESTQSLLRALFRDDALFEDVPTIRKRIVAWGDGASSVTLPHSALMISENDLLHRLRRASYPVRRESSTADWSIFCGSGLAPEDTSASIGSRTATFNKVQLRPTAEGETCWMESVDQGWLFLFAAFDQTGWLIACGGAADALLSQSRLIAAQIVCLIESSAPVDTSPRLRDRLCDMGWLACGPDAVMFDPICGEGAGNAVREAILAAAVVQAASRGEDIPALLQHYQSRLTLGFLRHLHMSTRFYATGGTGDFWQQQLHATLKGIEELSRRIHDQPAPVFRLKDLQLERIAAPVPTS